MGRFFRGTLAEKMEAYSIPEPNTGCRLWMRALDNHGYAHIWDGERVRLGHQVAWELARGPIPPGKFVCHKCDMPPCVEAGHLFIGTHDDNMADMAAKGRAKGRLGQDCSGERNGRAKLTAADVRAIRASNQSRAALAKHYGMSCGQISNICTGVAWGSVT